MNTSNRRLTLLVHELTLPYQHLGTTKEWIISFIQQQPSHSFISFKQQETSFMNQLINTFISSHKDRHSFNQSGRTYIHSIGSEAHLLNPSIKTLGGKSIY
uniref:Uncharacterized protein n=2 Tax=Picea TaxID=3328 RepID=A0A101M5M0_PICGL|nr:hypothetical protein ABT39_MTgene1156 [Picea glauca]QHR91714.1 hypothetical protein Q903MT_gene5750 [Picea sitchensis]